MSQYRKKPVVIEAFQMTEAHRWDNSEWPIWLDDAWREPTGGEGSLFCEQNKGDDHTQLYIGTKEGTLNITFGDWIIQGVQGEIYPCKPDIFDATYEPVEKGA